jgi:hypothetical protein
MGEIAMIDLAEKKCAPCREDAPLETQAETEKYMQQLPE